MEYRIHLSKALKKAVEPQCYFFFIPSVIMNTLFKLMSPCLELKHDLNFTDCMLAPVASCFIHVPPIFILQATLLAAFFAFSACVFFLTIIPQPATHVNTVMEIGYLSVRTGNSLEKKRGK